MHHVDVGEGEVGEGLADLARELADEHERDAAEAPRLEDVVQRHGQVLKDEADVAAVLKVVDEAHCEGAGASGTWLERWGWRQARGGPRTDTPGVLGV